MADAGKDPVPQFKESIKAAIRPKVEKFIKWIQDF